MILSWTYFNLFSSSFLTQGHPIQKDPAAFGVLCRCPFLQRNSRPSWSKSMFILVLLGIKHQICMVRLRKWAVTLDLMLNAFSLMKVSCVRPSIQPWHQTLSTLSHFGISCAPRGPFSAAMGWSKTLINDKLELTTCFKDAASSKAPLPRLFLAKLG